MPQDQSTPASDCGSPAQEQGIKGSQASTVTYHRQISRVSLSGRHASAAVSCSWHAERAFFPTHRNQASCLSWRLRCDPAENCYLSQIFSYTL